MLHTASIAPSATVMSSSQAAQAQAPPPEDRSPIMSQRDSAVMAAAHQIFKAIDVLDQGSISKLDLIDAVQRNAKVEEFVAPSINAGNVLQDASSFDALDAVFSTISEGRKRIRKHTFVRYFRKASVVQPTSADELLELFQLIDQRGTGTFSRFELLAAVQKSIALAEFLVPGQDCSNIMHNEQCFDALDSIFDEIAAGRQRASFQDFDTYVRLRRTSVHHNQIDRSSKRILIIGQGFSSRFLSFAEKAGYQVHLVNDLPDLESSAPSTQAIGRITGALEVLQPHLVACASKAGLYMTCLWQLGLWRGPTVMINVHPSLQQLPQNVPIVVAHGGNDVQYKRSRASLEQLVSTGTANMCFLYHNTDANAGAPGQCLRKGDGHLMESLLKHDLLPRLMDAAMSQQCPETYMLWSCQHQLCKERLDAERWLSYSPVKVREYWESTNGEHEECQKLFAVSAGSQEFNAVAAIFTSSPQEPSVYGRHSFAWDRTRIAKIERVENGLLETGSAEPYFETLKRSIEEQGVAFEEGVHTRWGFHASDNIDSIVSDPIAGFIGSDVQPWGSGTYFCRDARLLVESNSTSKRMLLCLLMTGIPCLGDASQHGILPFRQKPHRYNSAVDSFSDPEIFVLHHPGAAYPAYIITFA
jgi:Ca2+-binding EF-hand superfamily protein